MNVPSPSAIGHFPSDDGPVLQAATRNSRPLTAPLLGNSLLLLLLFASLRSFSATPDYRNLGYMYLSPVPGAEYTSTQTRYILVRFQNISPTSVTNLSSFIQVTGAISGAHSGQTKIALDGRTVIFDMPLAFQRYEKVTVALNPQVGPGAGGTVSPYQYQFVISGTMTNLYTNLPPGIITARGDNPPNETKECAFDGIIGTKWLDFSVPNGTANFSWIQYVYPSNQSQIVVQYSVTSANDAPERDPADWRFYGVDALGALTLLDIRTNQTFPNRFQTKTYGLDNTNAWRGYRLEIRRVNNPATAVAVQLAELQFIGPGSTPIITARGDNPPNETKDKAFDGTTSTKWLDAIDPNGTTNFSWLQYIYAGIESHAVNQYSISSANDVPERDPADWHLYGVSGSGARTLLDTQTGQTFPNRLQTKTYPISNTNLYRGYQLEITRVANPSIATCVQLSELQLSYPAGMSLAVKGTPSDSNNSAAVTKPTGGSTGPFNALASVSTILPNGVSVPSDFPYLNITVNNNPDTNYIFMDNRIGGPHGYNVIFDNNGFPIWYSREPDEHRDMKVQPNGMMTMLARDGGLHFNGFDNHYQLVTNYWAVNGYSGDDHELQVLPDGTYYLLALRTEVVDMTRFVSNGSQGASVTEEILQGFSPAGELIFQWRAWDNFDIHDEQQFIDITSSGFDFPHFNAIDFDTDGNILLSSRNTSEITKINKDNGDIIWRLGGAHGQFTFSNDPLNGPRNQHSIRRVGTNHYILFDNGNLHNPSESRGVEYVLDTTNMTAAVAWQYPNPATSTVFSSYMGNVQRLANSNTLINWAVIGLPKLTEVRPDGIKAFEMDWASPYETYRVWRCPWHGSAIQPYLLTESYPDNLTLIFNQFGDTNVAYYRIYGGTSPAPTNLLATSTTTLKQLNNLTNGATYYFRVTAVNHQGLEGLFSNETNATINIIKPGQNMVSNGDFSQSTNSWVWTLAGGATASWAIESGVTHVYVTNATPTFANIQLKQTGKPLVQGKKYVFEFDAWSTATRYIEAKVAQDASPNQNYSGTTSTFITPAHNHFRFVFTMNAATDFNASIFFNMGASVAGVFLDNVSLYYTAPGDINTDGHVDLLDFKMFSGDWLKQSSGLGGDLNGNGKVDFTDFGIFGENWSGN